MGGTLGTGHCVPGRRQGPGQPSHRRAKALPGGCGAALGLGATKAGWPSSAEGLLTLGRWERHLECRGLAKLLAWREPPGVGMRKLMEASEAEGLGGLPGSKSGTRVIRRPQVWCKHALWGGRRESQHLWPKLTSSSSVVIINPRILQARHDQCSSFSITH